MMQDQKIEKGKKVKKKTLVLISWWSSEDIKQFAEEEIQRFQERDSSAFLNNLQRIQHLREIEKERERDSSAFQNNL